MTTYYIDPYTGDDSNSGLSWALPWRTMKAIEMTNTVLVGGDLVKIAKSPETSVTSSTADTSPEVDEAWRLMQVGVRMEDSISGDFYLPGEGAWYSASQTYLAGSMLNLSSRPPLIQDTINGSSAVRYSSRVLDTTSLPAAGTISTSLVSSGGTQSEPEFPEKRSAVSAITSSGLYNVVDSVLFPIGTHTTSVPSAFSTYSISVESLSACVRCSPTFYGAGTDVDMPEGALQIKMIVKAAIGGALLHEAYSSNLPAIRNSDSIWTPFTVDFPDLPILSGGSNYILDFYLCRTSLPIDRDSSEFGLVVSPGSVHPTSLGSPSSRVYMASRGDAIPIPYNIPPITGDPYTPVPRAGAATGCAGNIPAYLTTTLANNNNGNIVLSAHSADNTRLSTDLVRVQAAYVDHLTWRGSANKGVFYLGDSGGVNGDPVVVSGGWNPVTDVLEGITALSGFLPFESVTDCALFDLGWSDYFSFENIVAANGFSSFFTRGRNVKLKNCCLPFSFKPGFGDVSPTTNVSLEDMYVPPYALAGFGTIGNFSIKNVYAPYDAGSSADARNEVNDLYINDSHIGRVGVLPLVKPGGGFQYGFIDVLAPIPLFVRGNAVLDNQSPLSQMCLVSVDFGHTLEYINPKGLQLIGTYTKFKVPGVYPHELSRWDRIKYAAHPTYDNPWSDGGKRLWNILDYPRVTCDRLIDQTEQVMTYGATSLLSSVYLMPDSSAFDVEYMYIGNDTEPEWPTGEGWRGTQTLVQQGKSSNSQNPHVYFAQMSTPPEHNQKDDTGPVYVTDNPQVASMGGLFLAKPFKNIEYRDTANVYLCSTFDTNDRYVNAGSLPDGVSPTIRPRVYPMKIVVLRKPGMYRARFGFMKENIRFTIPTSAIPNPVVATFSYDTQGKLTIADKPSTHMGYVCIRVDGHAQAVPYYSSSVEDIAGNNSNKRLNKWTDIYIDFSITRAVDVRFELWSDDTGVLNYTIFDNLEVVEAT